MYRCIKNKNLLFIYIYGLTEFEKKMYIFSSKPFLGVPALGKFWYLKFVKVETNNIRLNYSEFFPLIQNPKLGKSGKSGKWKPHYLGTLCSPFKSK